MDRYAEAVSLWQKKKIRNGNEFFAAFSGQVITYAYNSGKIENPKITYHDTREIFEHDGVLKYTGDLKTLFEIQNAKEANELMIDAFDRKKPLDLDLICKFQKKLTKGTYDKRRWELGERPGMFKIHDFVTGREEVGAAPSDVKEELQELVDEMQDFPKEKVLVAASYFHAKFENIHPFADGNGRTGRLLMNYIMISGDHPPVTIFEDDKQEYYEALFAWDTTLDLKPLKDFLMKETVRTWEHQIARAESRKKKQNINSRKDIEPEM